ncbi:MAG: C45 family autoproteolytic acyltransferase/hydrolase [Actinomycetota bacterium]|nr:C45 family autoproteolytic acyltransferase/hydrolase [Actinomycetota bacterium]
MPEDPPDLLGLPDWVNSLGLPPEATAAIDRWWKPVWEALRDDLKLLPAHPGRAAQDGAELIEFEAVNELQPGPKWKVRFDAMWPTYRSWYLQDGEDKRPDLATCRRMLARHMPELVPTYDRLVELAGGDELAARMLSLYRPPGFVVGCSQGAWTRDTPVLVRNYDYPVSRLEGIVYLTRWSGRRVIGMSDCLWGLLDGVNDAGLAVSLTFGGRRDVGDGFAISLVVRYLLETCETVAQARTALARIPVHAAQNVTLLDRSSEFLTAYVGPGRAPEFHAVAATTNHQGEVEWPEYARAIRTVERERCVLALLNDPHLTRESFIAAFVAPPLHNTEYVRGFGTIYTAAYYPTEGRVEYRWPGSVWEQSFDRFEETEHAQTFTERPAAA